MQAIASRAFKSMGGNSDVMLAVGVLAVLMIMVVPLPTVLMDMFLAINISVGILILLTSLYVLKPLDFSIFPSLLLLTTLFRLALNVATTRLILLNGQEGPSAAGHVIEGFGEFVVGGNTVVGLIIFLILVLINFIVITKGSTRIAEVSARFTLDAMPGKQMAIDADLNAGLIDDNQARQRRESVAREAEFYGSMDGASKFVRGDAVAGLIITAINIFAGLIIGTMQQGMPLAEAMSIYSILTVGDGLVSQIPALVISTAAGIIITRAGGDKSLSVELTDQFTQFPRLFIVGSGAMLMLGFMPGLPFIPFAVLSAGAAIVWWYLKTEAESRAMQAEAIQPAQQEAGEQQEAPLTDLLVVDPIRLEVGYGLIDLVESSNDGNLLDRLKSVRKQIAQEIGFILPFVHIKDNLQLGVGEYKVLIRGAEVGRGEMKPRSLLALESQVTGPSIQGEPTLEPAFGLPAIWISNEQRQKAELSGYTVVEPATVIATHVTEILRKYSHEILDRAQVRKMVDTLSEQHGKIIDEIIPAQVSIGLLQNVLHQLLAEWVPIRDLLMIVESLADNSGQNLSVAELTARVRVRLGRNIVQQHLNPTGELGVFTIKSDIEQEMLERLGEYTEWALPLNINRWQSFLMRLNDAVSEHDLSTTIILTTPELRAPLSASLSKAMARIAVLSIAEIPSYIRVQTLGSIGLQDAN
ncbi:flagellar biosynthesis protein FlhA [Mariprofundus aestuarium]|uniref:Flagellar biosynthesis protein FlhA n=1 Tax=Mariprofundus aestuarium TaxID=1921086 RepID=A0A2K8KXM2_MARES|nr:flagellar biosynthesis protein FlhA [Mariprofundus aestuarium]ATX78599.1 flagellar biosynthesis protein FlhA [Mariprofundus aestuarium]